MKAADIVAKWAEVQRLKKQYEQVEGDYENLMHTYLGRIWKQCAGGIKWEAFESYHPSCYECNNRAILILQRILIDEPDYIIKDY